MAWCERLGIESQGSADELKKRLYNYYRIKPGTTPSEEKKNSGNIITIDTAENLEYFTIEKVDEDYVEISGNVELTMTDQETGEIHIIKADRILFNFKENYLTATGNIRYILQGTDKTENFIGEKLTFNVETWEGLFSKGQSEELQESEEEDITFYFKGDLINKTEDNFVILEKGEITSCDLDDPHYKLRAEKIWLLSGDEWAMLNGVLYIGRIPILFIPGFIHAGDEIFFNPVIGYREDFGYYLQTTTYLIGKKEEDDDSSFSFLKSEDDDEYTKLNGIYLTKDEGPSQEKKDFLSSFSSDDYFKIMLDTYSSRGIFLGTEGSINELLIFQNLDIYTAIAFTRKIESSSSGYTYLFLNDDGEYASIWESSFFYNIEIPFRYGADISFGLDFDWISLDFLFQSWSDSEIVDDFDDREESLDLLGMLDSESESSTSSSSSITSGSWEISTDISPDVSFLNPFIKTFSITDLKTSLTWKQKDIDSGYEETTGEFFYPENYLFPSFSATLSGTILPITATSAEDKKGSEESEEKKHLDLLPPWSNNENGETSDEKNKEKLPDMRSSIDNPDYISDVPVFLDNSLSYTISPSYSLKTQMDYSDWETPDDIDIESAEYSYEKATLSASLDYDLGILDDLITISNSLDFSGKYSKHFNMDSLSEDQQEDYLLEDKQATSLDLSNDFILEISPFRNNSALSGTTLSYEMDSTIYNYDYSSTDEMFITSVFDFTEDYISSHKMQLDLPLEIYDYSQTLTIISTLPPLDFESSGSFIVNYGPSYTKINTAVEETDEDVFEFDPLTVYEKITFAESTYISNNIDFDYTDFSFGENEIEGMISLDDGNISLESSFTYDFEENSPTGFNAEFDFYGFYVNFAAENTYDYIFDLDSGWEQQSTKSFQASSFQTGISIETDPIVFWRNRINLDYSVSAEVDYDLIEFSDSIFNFDFSFSIEIFKFLTLKISTESENTQIFRYIDSFASATGLNTLNFFDDLFKSFNFFNEEDRYESNFNLKTITVGLEHDLHDWELNIDYSGYPEVNEDLSPAQYEWISELSIYLQWKAISDIKSEISIDDGEISF